MTYNAQAPTPYYQTPGQQTMPYQDYTQPYMPMMPVYPTYPGSQPMRPSPVLPPDMEFGEGPPTTTDIGYTPAYLKTQIGKRVKIEFLIGTNLLIDREGILEDVGINYVIIKEAETDDLVLGDLYSIKFVKFYF